MSNTRVREHLVRRFEEHRIVVWHDPEQEFSDELDVLAPDGVDVVRVQGDEFAVKHLVTRERPRDRFLVYRSGSIPAGADNWLLDLELAYCVFTADRNTLLRTELGLTELWAEGLFLGHQGFFKNRTLLGRFKRLLQPGDDQTDVQAKMCAAVLNQTEHSFSELVRSLLIAHAGGDHSDYDALAAEGLTEFTWDGARKIYGYEAATPSMADFVLWMFRQAADGFAGADSRTKRNLEIDFRSLRNDRRSEDALKTLAKQAEKDLAWGEHARSLSLPELVMTDTFEAAEQAIIGALTRAIETATMSEREAHELIRQRKQRSVWFDDYKRIYAALEAAAAILPRIKTLEIGIASFDDGLAQYRDELYRIDQLYRQFTYAKNAAERKQPLETLAVTVENAYVNDFLYPLGVAWQEHLDRVESWKSSALRSQTSFYSRHVEPVLQGGRKKVVVIISDAMRYEIAEELHERVLGENRFAADIDAMLGVLPSYTQLGMAALLPHASLAHSAGGDPVLVDGRRSDGTENRSKILASVDGAAIQAGDFLALSGAERRELYASHKVLYVYHDVIDAIGDKAASERKVFTAVKDAMNELMDLVRALASANATNIVVTADHGFLYQDGKLPKQFTLTAEPHGDEILLKNRRYVLGRGLKKDQAFRKFTSAEVGLESDLDVLTPNSIHRIAKQGAGSRFVHGGAMLQEIVVPVVSIRKVRADTVSPVDVDIHPESDKITTGQMVVKLYQTAAVTAQRPERKLRAGLYFGDELVSNRVELVFDQSSEEPRDRFQSVRLLLAQEADAANEKRVELRLEEPITGTEVWKTYKSVHYTLRRAFGTDFDF
ncbi:BREX-1 system phosphatase PglZ type A [Leucobacter insecticola]|uniref:BREX-1 system phosphatase PglZ type A n=1 Tax=Leucobacter insecticola TaxID=2714934 RepID=A0A6G8FGR4_9MICO|nr:BREX-1 system phosphatase PglZ type A [Leucobacter insecticola]QIM15459.1 BREX-1 system phosphatase PglZ type A [Leucobacter insecticola]